MTTFILITQMFPSVMLLVPFYSVINQLKLINTHLGLIIVYISFTIPFSTWMMIGFFKSLPLELDEAARIDAYIRLSLHGTSICSLSFSPIRLI